MFHPDNNIIGIMVENSSKKQILEKIKKNIGVNTDFFHIVSLNPEIMVIATKDNEFKTILNRAQMKIIDGFGIVMAARILDIPIGERYTGSDLLKTVLNGALDMPLRVLLIGGRPNLAKDIADCYQNNRTQIEVKGITGIKNIENPQKNEEDEIFSIIADYRPHMMFVAFGSPRQEKWLWSHRDRLKGIICMGVGGGFDFLGGKLPRAPYFMRRIGLEWMFRLVIQPWRWKRQIRLITFVYLIAKQKLNLYSSL